MSAIVPKRQAIDGDRGKETPRPRPPNCAENVDGDFLARAGARGAYSYSPRDGAATAAARRGGTLRTGYCDREIDEDRPAKFESLTHRDVNFSESEISGILGRDGRTNRNARRHEPPGTLNGEFDPGSG